MRVIWIGSAIATAAAATAALAIFGGAAASAAPQASNSVALVAYSTPKDAYTKIISAFNGTSAGKGVSFTQSYGASADQAAAVAAGQPADVVALSLKPDISTLVAKGIVAKNWQKTRYQAMVSDSIAVFIVRDGNPKHIHTWADLLKPGIQVITPNPISSGGARWDIMAAYGAQLKLGKTKKQAVAYLRKLFTHVPVLPTSAREALTTFASGKGDVLLDYENDAIFANKKGVHTDFVRPKQTILIENPVALTKSGAKKPAAKAFVKYLTTPAAQRIFAQNGYRPVVKKILKQTAYPNPKQLFTIAYVGGWAKVEKQFFGPKNGIVTKIISSLGK
jgi:sulfate/thiosulfate transport system substrate-binding protein